MSTVLKHAPSLSVEDRLELIEELWESLVATPEAIPVTDAQRRELARRRRVHARNPSAAKSWGEVRARLARLKVRPLRLTPEAELDLDDAHAWYHAQIPASPASFSRPLARRLPPSDAIRKPFSSSIPQCVAPYFGAFRTASSSKSAGRRSSSTPCST